MTFPNCWPIFSLPSSALVDPLRLENYIPRINSVRRPLLCQSDLEAFMAILASILPNSIQSRNRYYLILPFRFCTFFGSAEPKDGRIFLLEASAGWDLG